MENFDAKRFACAIGGVILLLLLIRIASVAFYEPRNLGRPEYIVLGLIMAHPPGGAPAPPEPMPDWSTAFARADLAAGQKVSRQCIGCHDLSPANANMIGPGLHDVVGRARASHTGFAYSSAMVSKPGRWTPDELFVFLRDPQLFIPWTKMSFAGIPSAQDRINLIAYLRANGERAVASAP